MNTPKLIADFLPELPSNHFWRLQYDSFGFYDLQIRRTRKYWISAIVAETVCPLDDGSIGDLVEDELLKSAEIALKKFHSAKRSAGILTELADYEGDHYINGVNYKEEK